MSKSKSSFDGSKTAKKLSTEPGVYLFRDAKGKLLYVGKARNLRKRVSSYFDRKHDDLRLVRMVRQIRKIDTHITRTEGEALMLENEWIKSLKPRFNIKLRDDKSYPWIHLTGDHDFPRAHFHRGARNEGGEYFGPYPNAGATRDTLKIIHRVFKLRMCQDSIFDNRSRPCLQYQIKRCTAPCVDYISKEKYAEDVAHAQLLLSGRSSKVRDLLMTKMQQASQSLEFEQAAVLRDQLQTLTQVHAQQFVTAEGGDMDYIALAQQHGMTVVQILTIRDGRNLGNQTYHPDNSAESRPADIMAAVIGQYYHVREAPKAIILSHLPSEAELWQQVLSERAKRKVKMIDKPRGIRLQWLKQVRHNAEQSINVSLAEQAGITERLQALGKALNLDEPPQHIECFDVSHTSGERTVASCVVYDHSGINKSLYRRFNIKDIVEGDDYAAMRQVLLRRYKRQQKQGARLPDLIVVDGGLGQVRQALEVLSELELQHLLVMGVAKGRTRRSGYEHWVLPPPQPEVKPEPSSVAAHLIQQIRDEAHRFAITGHRQRRGKARKASVLEGIPGIGPKRRRDLLQHFGGIQGLRKAGVGEVMQVQGINQELAERIVASIR